MRRPSQGETSTDYRDHAEWIRWVDSVGDQDWTDDTTGPDVGPIDSLGFVMEEDSTKVVLIQNVGEDGARCHRIAIPKCAILKRWPIGKRRPRRKVAATRTNEHPG